ncbi:hypothetical protein SFB21_1385 [Acinetobacter bouvetii]|uniref:YDG domain-containing protein n=1 Tax=Acinetobacter bouvetii TaxID=202951 RepID=A0A811GE36_9GAMM|nr:hypothetical protein SFB21_1385 [Acinetobacter bouvetii]
MSGADAGNYVLASTTLTDTADITARTLTVNSDAQNRVYDGTTAVHVNLTDDRISNDNLTVTGSSSFADKNVGIDKTVTTYGLTLSGADAGNYVLASTPVTTKANITPATLTATMTAQNKVYDAGTSAIVSYGDDRITGDVVTVNGTANFSDKNVANGKVVTATGLRLSGADAGNYVLASTTLTDTADITARTLAVNSDAQNRVYDGTTAVHVNLTDDRISNDNLTVTGSSSFADKNVGIDKTVTTYGLTLSGADAGNYVLASTTVIDTADITKAKISQVSGITANNRVYDATTGADLNTSSAQFNGMVAGDQLAVVTASGQFDNKNVGTAKQVSISNISLNGADAHNYELVNTTAQTTADISQADISSISGIAANNRHYDGLTAASLNTDQAQFNGMVAGDQLSVATATGAFDDALPGQTKTVRISGLSLGGADAHNYRLLDTTALTTADIVLLTPAAYLQAIQFKRPRYLPETNNAINTINIELRQGGINTSGIQTLAGEH